MPTATAEPMAGKILDPTTLAARYREVRGFTERLCQPLETEDYVVQSMPDASPAKWHLGHTTWFFEAFVLSREPSYEIPDPEYHYLFNSYYNTLGRQFFRPDRGKLSRPTVAETCDYRRRVDEAMMSAPAPAPTCWRPATPTRCLCAAAVRTTCSSWATSGSGLRAPTLPTPASRRRRGRSASTTPSS